MVNISHENFYFQMGSGVERIDPLHFLAGCSKRQLNQALSVLSLIRSTSNSRPNNIRGGGEMSVRSYVRPSVHKKFLRFQ